MNKNINVELLKEQLTAVKYNGEIVCLPETKSTQDDAKDFIKNNGVKQAIFVTDRQTDGRGRLTRKWAVSDANSITFSILVRPQIAPSKVPLINYAAAMAVKYSLKNYDIAAEIKWPNDILLNGKKLCGIISESATVCDSLFYVITGFGINVNQDDIEDFPNEIKDTATSLKIENGKEFIREKLLAEIVQNFIKYLELLEKDSKGFITAYSNSCDTLGKTIRIILDEEEFTAVAENICDNGSLLVNKNGEKLPLFAADVIHLRNA